jgi:hypothetical protein
MLNFITSYFGENIIRGAILGSIIIPLILFLMRKIVNFLTDREPKKLLFGQLVSQNKPCYIYFVKLFDNQRTNSYSYNLTDYFPPETSNRISQKINTPYVWAEADGQCAIDLVNILGNVGKLKNIFIKDPSKDWDLWEGNIICIGGSEKANAILDRCDKKFCTLSDDKTRIKMPSEEELDAVGGEDYGMIQKLKDPNTGFDCWIIMGVGVMGTLSAGYYLRNYAKELGNMLEGREFCCLIKSRFQHGPASAMLYKVWPKPYWYKKFFHPILWIKKYRKACLENAPSKKTINKDGFITGGSSSSVSTVIDIDPSRLKRKTNN